MVQAEEELKKEKYNISSYSLFLSILSARIKVMLFLIRFISRENYLNQRS